MSLISTNIDDKILGLIFSQDYKHNTMLLGKMYKIFRGRYPEFLSRARDLFFSLEFTRCGVTNIDDLICKIIHKKSIRLFDCYRQFHHHIDADTMFFSSTNRRSKEIIKFLSLYYSTRGLPRVLRWTTRDLSPEGYYGYCCEYTNTQYHEASGYEYYDFHSDSTRTRQEGYTLKELRAKRVHNPKYYTKSESGLYTAGRWRPSVVLRPNTHIYKVGATSERQDITCTKCI
jgi:hypothetical protein